MRGATNQKFEVVETKNNEVLDKKDCDKCGRHFCSNISCTSLLLFFLLLVCILKKYDCDCSMDTLLMFFLLLVVLTQGNNKCCCCN